MMELMITDQNFEEEVKNSDLPVMVDFFAQWCGPCKMMGPLVAQLAEEYNGKCKIGKCDIDENQKLVTEFRIMSVPTFIFFKGGEAVASLTGAVSKKELQAKIEQVMA